MMLTRRQGLALGALAALSDARLSEINDALARNPLRDVCMVCPFIPNGIKDPGTLLLDGYAEYIAQALLPAVRAASPTLAGPRHLGLDGVSLGGYVAIEVF